MGPHAKKRKLTPSSSAAVQEITFDPSARQEFLTGFHKRKLQRAKHAQEAAERRAKEERKEARKKLREDRRAEFERAIAENRALMKEISRSNRNRDPGDSSTSESEDEDENEDEEWEGIPDPPAVDYEAEYIDEDKYTTVTVEEVDASRDGLVRRVDEEESDEEGEEDKEVEAEESKDGEKNDTKAKKRVWTKKNPKSGSSADRPRKKKRQFRYENKAERKFTKLKERMGNRKKAKERKGK
ncbi:hypothetical protein AJ79_04859 [Helicocarpus griseus UAMH5409]|uniref:Ribosomal RNA-processing protein 17 n=1 Tax=Helicocarpus griseus UAMH5409 TaxID=1447875 RepID=A0A2B7XID1_9EURO|nr:hypothetical protein AJ79_04859 [Helicocarpus griseus UAMH5409]